jgi:hypothetical protein
MKQIILSFIFTLVLGVCAMAQSAKSTPLKVFPNPTTEYFQVGELGETASYISVFNIMGRNVREFEFVKDERYYIADLPKGLYLIHLQDKNKKTIATQKIEKR